MSGDTVYITGESPCNDAEHNVYSYNTTTDCWQQLPQSGHCRGVLCMVDNKLTIFGGRDSTTNVMHSKVTTFNSNTNQWTSHFPDMLYVRSKPGVVSYREYVIVMGGGYSLDDDHDNIEIMSYHERRWEVVSARLPVPMYNINPTISGEYITIVGYTNHARQTESYQIPITDITSSKNSACWKSLGSATHHNSAIVPYSNPPVTVGGEAHVFNCTSDIKVYDTSSDSWQSVGNLTSGRDSVGVAHINEYTIIVIGGTSGGPATSENCLKTVEIGCIVASPK